MVKQVLQVLAFVAVALSASAHAQCVPQKGQYIDQNGFVADQPRHIDPSRGGCYVPQGTPRLDSQTNNQVVGNMGNVPIWGNGAGQQVIAVQQPYQNQQVMVGQQSYVPWVQTVVQRPAVAPNCTLIDKPVDEQLWDGVKRGVLGAVTGLLAGRTWDLYRGNTDHRWQKITATGGLALGFYEGSAPGKVLVCREPAQQQVAVNQPQTIAQQGFAGGQQISGDGKICSPGLVRAHLREDLRDYGLGNYPGQEVCAKQGDPNMKEWAR